MLRRLLNAISAYLPENRITFEGDVYLRRFYVCGRLPPELAAYFRHGPKPKERLGWLNTRYLHCFKRPDRDRDLHNHPWDGDALVLTDGYVEERWCGVPQAPGSVKRLKVVHAGQVNRLTASTYHRVAYLLADEVWTWFATGKKVQSWGFWDEDLRRHVPHREYVSKCR